MKSSEFIISKIDTLVNKYPTIKCIYEFDEYSKSHYIEVLPSDLFVSNKNFHTDESSILIDFINEYSNETITFITERDLYSIENPIYEKQGILFNRKVTVFSNYLLDLNNCTPNFLNISEILEIITSKNNYNFETTLNSIFYTSFENTSISPIKSDEPKEESLEFNYAFAA